jgi:hypothetical protein
MLDGSSAIKKYKTEQNAIIFEDVHMNCNKVIKTTCSYIDISNNMNQPLRSNDPGPTELLATRNLMQKDITVSEIIEPTQSIELTITKHNDINLFKTTIAIPTDTIKYYPKYSGWYIGKRGHEGISCLWDGNVFHTLLTTITPPEKFRVLLPPNQELLEGLLIKTKIDKHRNNKIRIPTPVTVADLSIDETWNAVEFIIYDIPCVNEVFSDRLRCMNEWRFSSRQVSVAHYMICKNVHDFMHYTKYHNYNTFCKEFIIKDPLWIYQVKKGPNYYRYTLLKGPDSILRYDNLWLQIHK